MLQFLSHRLQNSICEIIFIILLNNSRFVICNLSVWLQHYSKCMLYSPQRAENDCRTDTSPVTRHNNVKRIETLCELRYMYDKWNIIIVINDLIPFTNSVLHVCFVNILCPCCLTEHGAPMIPGNFLFLKNQHNIHVGKNACWYMYMYPY